MFRVQSGLVGESIYKDLITTMWYYVNSDIVKERQIYKESRV